MLLEGLFSGLVDKRKARGKRYQQEPLICGLLLAVMSGATSLRKMEIYLNQRLPDLNTLFGTTWKKAPSWVGIRRFLLKLDVSEVEEALREHAKKLSKKESESPQEDGKKRQFIALDGKALRGSASRVTDAKAKQLVSAFTQDDLIILGHIEIGEKTNEIPAARELIEALGAPGHVFTLDALHCQKKHLN